MILLDLIIGSKINFLKSKKRGKNELAIESLTQTDPIIGGLRAWVQEDQGQVAHTNNVSFLGLQDLQNLPLPVDVALRNQIFQIILSKKIHTSRKSLPTEKKV